MKKRYTLYINDSYIYLLDLKKNKIYEEKFNSLFQDEIINEQKFYFELNKFIRKNKIKISILGYNIEIIINDNLNQIQKEKFKEFLEDYFRKIIFLNVSDILLKDKKKSFINITENYIDYYYLKNNEKNNIRINKKIFNNSDTKSVYHALQVIYKPRNIILFGNSNNIPRLTNKINKELGIKCSYEEDCSKYIINKMKRNTQ